MKQQSLCIECGESITNPLCPECLVEQAIARVVDMQVSTKLKDSEVEKLNKKLAEIIKTSYVDEGVGCISCNSTFAICPKCTARYLGRGHNILPYLLAIRPF